MGLIMRKTKQAMKADATDIHIGLKIAELRLIKGMSRNQLSTKVGVSHQQIQKYETAENRISPGRLLRMANAFGITVGSFFDGLQGELPILNHRSRLIQEIARNASRIKDEPMLVSINQLARTAADRK